MTLAATVAAIGYCLTWVEQRIQHQWHPSTFTDVIRGVLMAVATVCVVASISIAIKTVL